MTLGSDIEERSGGSVTYDNGEELAPKAEDEAPKGELNAPVAARALLACDLSGRLLMMMVRNFWQREREKRNREGRVRRNVHTRKFVRATIDQ
jgi:hypothetical protein